MKYLLSLNFSNFLVKFKKINIIYFLFILTMILIVFIPSRELNENDAYRILGLNFDLDSNDIISFLSYFVYILYFAYISIILFVEDFRTGEDILFLRLSKKKWSICKVLSIFVILILVRLLYYIMFIVILKDVVLLRMLLFDLCYILFLSIIIIMLLCLNLKYKFIIVIFCLIFNKFIFLNIKSISVCSWLMTFFVSLILIVFVIIYMYKNITYICERLE